MSDNPSIEVKQDFILVTFSDAEIERSDVMSFAEKFADICEAHQIYRVLLDARNLDYLTGNMFDMMSLGDSLLEKMLVFRFHRFADVVNSEHIDKARDFEAVARNRGMNYRVFASFEAAKGWVTDTTAPDEAPHR